MGAVNCTKAVWELMREQNYGRIVVTTSSSGLYGNFGQSNYGAAKMALVGLMQTLALEGEKNDIRVNCLAPDRGDPHDRRALMPDDVLACWRRSWSARPARAGRRGRAERARSSAPAPAASNAPTSRSRTASTSAAAGTRPSACSAALDEVASARGESYSRQRRRTGPAASSPRPAAAGAEAADEPARSGHRLDRADADRAGLSRSLQRHAGADAGGPRHPARPSREPASRRRRSRT